MDREARHPLSTQLRSTDQLGPAQTTHRLRPTKACLDPLAEDLWKAQASISVPSTLKCSLLAYSDHSPRDLMRSKSGRSDRMVQITCNKEARNNRSGAVELRPGVAYRPSNSRSIETSDISTNTRKGRSA